MRTHRETIGVLALQGGFAAHGQILATLGHTWRAVRGAEDLRGLGGLVLPGGESTAQLRLLVALRLTDSILAFAASGRPILATCAGLILAARRVLEPDQTSLGLIDVTVSRNAYGGQRESFEAHDDQGSGPFLFIRAPRIRQVGRDVAVVGTRSGEPILVRGGNITCATFHPELSGVTEIHQAVFGDRGGPLGERLYAGQRAPLASP